MTHAYPWRAPASGGPGGGCDICPYQHYNPPVDMETKGPSWPCGTGHYEQWSSSRNSRLAVPPHLLVPNGTPNCRLKCSTSINDSLPCVLVTTHQKPESHYITTLSPATPVEDHLICLDPAAVLLSRIALYLCEAPRKQNHTKWSWLVDARNYSSKNDVCMFYAGACYPGDRPHWPDSIVSRGSVCNGL